MNDLRTIITFELPHDAHLVKTKLESEGIQVTLNDELTVQVDNYISNAIGGIKLQVLERDIITAKSILKELGYIKTKSKQQNFKNSFWFSITSKIPIIGKLAFELRILILIGIVITIGAISIVISQMPSKYELLTGETWYLNMVKYNGKYYQPNTMAFKLVLNNGYSEYIDFETNGTVRMPGFNTNWVNGKWKLENGKVIIFDSDTLNYIYDGNYEITVNSNSILLKSESTEINGHSNTIRLF
ncbi:DUF2007 domain-containing protein [Carboxylicivirga mesophila]|uniref:DUF2007 domain-containing protein n=1 Tax=Carboxylicivirga mesophila TaxID=1166478 RepID=A0ABS5KHR2_9BACT|nr:DUF2007 domain-containing protein [Carboxylicivirga mesophila]MBS2213848.1 DUF2007 domain-containing protein [Carboxylicivirga mesophila]